MIRILRYLLIALLMLAIGIITVWSSLALWFRVPGPEVLRLVASVLFALFGLGTIVALTGSRRITALGLYLVAFACVLAWWSTIRPPVDGNWSPDVARQVTGQIDGDVLTLTNVREFDWRSDDDFSEVWTNRSFDLNQLETLDMFLSYWDGPEMAHFVLSFGFSDGQYLAWSVEVRREIGGGFRPVADAFKTNTLAIVATVERDVVGVRSNIRGEDVQIFRLRTPPDRARRLLEEYVRDANALAREPEFYNSLTTNCTTVVFKMMAAIGVRIPLDWRLLVNGYLPDYAYERNALDTRVSLPELRKLAHIGDAAQANGLGSGFSEAIRVGVPTPQR